MTKISIVGWITLLIGSAVWVYGYFVVGHPSIIDWRANTPWWIADFLPNVESEVGTLHRKHGADVLANLEKQVATVDS